MKELSFGNKRIYVMTGEERDRLVSLIHATFRDSGFISALSRQAVYNGFADEDVKKLYVETTKDTHEHVTKLFREFA